VNIDEIRARLEKDQARSERAIRIEYNLKICEINEKIEKLGGGPASEEPEYRQLQEDLDAWLREVSL